MIISRHSSPRAGIHLARLTLWMPDQVWHDEVMMIAECSHDR